MIFAVPTLIGSMLIGAATGLHYLTRVQAFKTFGTPDPLSIFGWVAGGLVALPCGLILLVLIVLCWNESRMEKRLLRSGTEIMATIASRENNFGRMVLHLEFALGYQLYFRTLDGYGVNDGYIAQKVWETRIGNKIPMLYDPNNPNLNRAVGELGYICDELDPPAAKTIH